MSPRLSIALEKRTGDFELLAGFDMAQGLTAIFGPSGAGKTMLLDCIAGLRTPELGSVVLQGRTLFNNETNTNLAPEKRNVGYVFQHGRLFPHMSVRQNLEFGMKRAEANQTSIALKDVTSLLGIDHLLDRRPLDLSGGEQQRVAMGRAFLSGPELLLMDEPLSALDTARRMEILPFIEKLRDTFEIPILYVSHNVDEVIRLADMVVLLDNGRIRARGPVEDLFNTSDHHLFLDQADSSQDASAPSTILTARVAEQDMPFGLTRAQCPGLSLWIPQIDKPIGETIRLRLRSHDIAISQEKPEKTSILNHFEAVIDTISQPVHGHVHLTLSLPSGQLIWSRITHRSATRLKLSVGDKVWGAIKSVAVVTGRTDLEVRQ